jgi:DNA modification methylase
MKLENTIIHGDFREFEIPQDAFLVSDPPYNQKYHYSLYADDIPTYEYYALLADAFKGRKSVLILYPEETINLAGGADSVKCNRLFRGYTTLTLQNNLA